MHIRSVALLVEGEFAALDEGIATRLNGDRAQMDLEETVLEHLAVGSESPHPARTRGAAGQYASPRR